MDKRVELLTALDPMVICAERLNGAEIDMQGVHEAKFAIHTGDVRDSGKLKIRLQESDDDVSWHTIPVENIAGDIDLYDKNISILKGYDLFVYSTRNRIHKRFIRIELEGTGSLDTDISAMVALMSLYHIPLINEN